MMKKLFRLNFGILFLILVCSNSHSQIVDIVELGTSATPALGTNLYVANEAIYTEAEIGANNFTTQATAIDVFGFYVSAVGTGTTFNNVKIYMKEVPLTTTTFSSGTYTNAGYTLVFNGSVTLASTGLTYALLTTPFVRTAGNNLQVLIERTDNITHTGYVYNCARGNETGVNALSTRRYNGTTALSGTTSLAASNFRQGIRLAHSPIDAAVLNLYSLGKLPLVYGNNHVIQARINNSSSSTLTNFDVTLNIAGANSFTDIQTITSLAPGATQTISFSGFTPTTLGANTIVVSVPSDDLNSNNSITWNQEVTQNLFSYKNPVASNEVTGVGFTGGTGDFVAGFSTASAGQINEIKVDFASSGQPYKIGIWNATGTGNAPGTLLWESMTLTSAVGTAFIPVPNVSVNGKFYVGVKQIGTTNVNFAYQTESPLRPANFYYTSPTGGTTWTNLSTAGLSFRFSIEPQFFIPQPPNCPINYMPTYDAANINPNSTVNLSWASGGGGSDNYDVYFGTSNPPPFVGNTTNTTYPVTLLPATTYYWSVVAHNNYGFSTGCDTLTFTTLTPVANDNANGAIPLTLGAGCAGADYTTVNASLSPGEPFPSCSGFANNPVWFSFVAPLNGAVRISTDVGTGGTLTDTKIALFSAENANSYSTFNIISCDEDGGSGTFTNNSVLYATGLTSGTTYYIAVDKFTAATVDGTFCIAVDALDASMLSSSNTCASTYQVPYSATGTTSYSAWVPLLDGSSKLVALVRNPAGGLPSGFTPAQNINTSGTVRQATNGIYYLDRSFRINNTTATNTDVQLFFLNSELAALTAMDATATLGNLNVTRQTSTVCNNDFDQTAGTNTAITASNSGNLGNVSYIQFNTPSFSNFYLMGGTTPLPIKLKSIDAKNAGASNQVTWSTGSEASSDYFELERSADGKAFSYLSKIAAKGQASDYVYYDKAPLANDNYYRLKLISKEGNFIYSKTVNATLNNHEAFTLEAYPNPVTKNVLIKVYGSENGYVIISDISGKVVLETVMQGSESDIDLSNVAAGIYFIKYTGGNFSKIIKIAKH